MAKKNSGSSKKAQTAGELYQSMQEVREAYNGKQGLGKLTSSVSNNSYQTQAISRLKDLVSTLHAQEMNFYSEFNIQGSNSVACLKNLQNKINQVKSSGLDQFQASNLHTLLGKIIGNVKFSNFDKQAFINILEENINNFYSLTENQEKFKNLTTASVIPMLNDIMVSKENITIQTDEKNKASGFKEDTKLSNSITVSIDSSTGKISLKADNLEINTDQKNKIINTFSEEQKKQFNTENTFFKQQVIDYLLQNVKLSSKAKRYVKYQCEINFDKYDLFGNVPNIIGFLGEVQFNSIMSMILGSENVVPTGNLKRLSGSFLGASIPIDSVIKSYGFQIKNYSTKTGMVNFSSSNKEVGTIISERLEMGDQCDLIKLFSIFQYNRPDQELSGDEGFSDYSNLYDSISNFCTSGSEAFFQSNLDKMLEIDTRFSSNLDVFHEDKYYFNTFFYINGTLVPASTIVQAIINSLSDTKKFSQSAFFSTFKIDKGESNVWKPAEEDQDKSSSFIALANKAKITYTISVDMTEILERAEQVAASY